METKCVSGHIFAVLNRTDNLIYCTVCGEFRAATPPEKQANTNKIVQAYRRIKRK